MIAVIGIALVISITFAVSLFRPGAAFGLVICIFALTQWGQSTSTAIALNTSLVYIPAGVVLLTAVVAGALRGNIGRISWLTVLIWAFLGWVALSSTWSAYGGATDRLQSVFHLLAFFALLSPWVIRDMKDLRAGFTAALLIGLPLIVILVFTAEWGFRGLLIAGAWDVRTNPLAIATWAGMLVMIVLLMNFKGLGRMWQMLRWAVILGGLYLVAMSQSRGQFFFIFAAVVPMLMFSRRIRNVWQFVALIVALGLLLILGSFVLDAIGAGARWERVEIEFALAGRLENARTLLAAWFDGGMQAFLVGLGYAGSFNPNIVGFYPHFVPAEVLGEFGLIGASLFVAMLVLGAYRWLWLYRAVAPYPVARGLVSALGAIILFDFLLGFKQGTLLSQFFLLGGLTIVDRLCCSLQRMPQAAGLPHVPALQPPATARLGGA